MPMQGRRRLPGPLDPAKSEPVSLELESNVLEPLSLDNSGGDRKKISLVAQSHLL